MLEAISLIIVYICICVCMCMYGYDVCIHYTCVYICIYIYNVFHIIKWRAAYVWWMLGDMSPGVGMSEVYLMAEDRHSRYRIFSTFYLKAETSWSHLTHICLSLAGYCYL